MSKPSSAVDPRIPSARGWGSFGFSVAAALGLNLAALCAFAAAMMPWNGPSSAADRGTWITAVSLPHRAVADLQTTPGPPPVAHAAPSGRSARAGVPVATQPAMASHRGAAAANTAGAPLYFYRTDEVDRPAEPDSDWNLDAAAFNAAGLRALVFDILIGRSGEVMGCTIIAPEALSQEVRHTLEERLRQTSLQPAIRGGVPVASIRRIEVSVL